MRLQYWRILACRRRNDSIHASADPHTPNLVRSQHSKILWSTQSNATLRSSRLKRVTCSSTSTNSFNRKVGMGSRAQDFVGDCKISRRTSSSLHGDNIDNHTLAVTADVPLLLHEPSSLSGRCILPITGTTPGGPRWRQWCSSLETLTERACGCASDRVTAMDVVISQRGKRKRSGGQKCPSIF